MIALVNGNSLRIPLANNSVHCVVTSPPYYGLRDYGVDGQLGLEDTPEQYIEKMVQVFREVKRVLRDDGTLWINIGDSYMTQPSWGRGDQTSSLDGRKHSEVPHALKDQLGRHVRGRQPGIKPKDLIGIPWMLAFALRADGWYLRSDIIWAKSNPMPESVIDRPTKSHEYVFLFSKAEKYFYNSEAVKEPSVTRDSRRPYGSEGAWKMDGRPNEQRHGGELRSSSSRNGKNSFRGQGSNRDSEKCPANRGERDVSEVGVGAFRNLRSVWTIATQPIPYAHYATFPQALVAPCIKAGCPENGIVLDPFAGSGTTGIVARQLGRNFVGLDLLFTYLSTIARKRLEMDALDEWVNGIQAGSDGYHDLPLFAEASL